MHYANYYKKKNKNKKKEAEKAQTCRGAGDIRLTSYPKIFLVAGGGYRVVTQTSRDKLHGQKILA